MDASKKQLLTQKAINKLVAKYLLENSCATIEQVSTSLMLPIANAQNVVLQLERENFIKKVEKTELTMPNFEINYNYGVVAIANLCDSSAYLVDLHGNTIATQSVGYGKTKTLQSVNSCVNAIKQLLNANAEYKLKAVVVVAFGMWDSGNGESVFAKELDVSGQLNLSGLFGNVFDVPIGVVNDTRVCLVAEEKHGSLAKENNGMLVYVDRGIASSLKINSLVYIGNNGFAGEIGQAIIAENTTLEDSCSLSAILKQVCDAVQKGEKTSLSYSGITIDSIINAYKNNDETVQNIVDKTAEILAKNVCNLMCLLDTKIIISGGAVNFGEKYLAVLKNEAKKFKHFNCEITFSKLRHEDALKLGTKDIAIEMLVENIANNILR